MRGDVIWIAGILTWVVLFGWMWRTANADAEQAEREQAESDEAHRARMVEMQEWRERIAYLWGDER